MNWKAEKDKRGFSVESGILTQVLPLESQYALDTGLVECACNARFYQFQIQILENVSHLCR